MLHSVLLLGAAASGGTAAPVRPSSDFSTAGWSASTGTNLFAMLDEAVADDGDYIFASVGSEPSTYVALLGNTLSPGTYTLRLRSAHTLAASQIRASLLDQNGAELAASAWIAGTTGPAQRTATLSITGIAWRLKIEARTVPQVGDVYLDATQIYLDSNAVILS